MRESFSLFVLEGIFYNLRIGNLSDDVSKLLNSLRLKEVNTGVFLKLDRKLSSTLKKIDPYVTYGYFDKF
jgi:ribosomal protein L30/L7E